MTNMRVIEHRWLLSTQPKIDQVDTVLMAEQYCNMAVIMIKQHC